MKPSLLLALPALLAAGCSSLRGGSPPDAGPVVASAPAYEEDEDDEAGEHEHAEEIRPDFVSAVPS